MTRFTGCQKYADNILYILNQNFTDFKFVASYNGWAEMHIVNHKQHNIREAKMVDSIIVIDNCSDNLNTIQQYYQQYGILEFICMWSKNYVNIKNLKNLKDYNQVKYQYIYSKYYKEDNDILSENTGVNSFIEIIRKYIDDNYNKKLSKIITDISNLKNDMCELVKDNLKKMRIEYVKKLPELITVYPQIKNVYDDNMSDF
ncbi:hypothetical protein Catovirus_1_508 [Catovirus CTV1]|uniref:Uncharacterized protein n=1 Tax=Catovirus CTV1 TaxID=1977631 RepID=A0A1V0S9X8_9VIRU|nr:hypothetical protein Catovirus_1_508 [Catovirus CTV1]